MPLEGFGVFQIRDLEECDDIPENYKTFLRGPP